MPATGATSTGGARGSSGPATVAFGCAIVATGALTVIGWADGARSALSLAPGLPPMKGLTAFALICGGIALICLRDGAGKRSRWVGIVLAALVALLGLAVGFEYLFGSIGIDQLLIADKTPVNPGRPSPHTAVALVVFGTATAVAGWRKPPNWVHDGLLALSGIAVLLALVGYVYGVPYLVGGPGRSGMSAHTIAALALWFAGLALLRPHEGLADLMTGSDAGARIARAMTPAAVLVPVLLGAVGFALQSAGVLDSRAGLATYTSAMVIGLMAVVIGLAGRARHEDLALRRLAALVSASADVMVFAWLDGRIGEWNPAAEQLYGYERAEVLGKPVSMLIVPPELHDESIELLGFAARGETCERETVRVRKDGTRVEVALSVAPVWADDGRIAGATVSAREITDRKLAERQLQHMATMLADAEATAGLGSWEYELSTGRAAWSPQLRQICGLDPAGLEPGDPQQFMRLVHPDDREPFESMQARVAETGNPSEGTFRIWRPDREERFLQTRTRLVGNGPASKLVGTVLDVTEMRRSELARNAAERRFRAAFEEAPIGVAIGGLRGGDRGRFLHANAALTRMIGWAPGELDGVLGSQITMPGDTGVSEDAYHRLDRGETIQFEKRYLHRDGHPVWALVSATPITTDDGDEPDQTVIQVLDISDRKRTERHLSELADRDSLSGLYNRRRFEVELQRVVGENRRYERRSALLLLDLDGFKAINDTLGHAAGDELVRRISALLRSSIRDSDIAARIGGDEFAIILPESGPEEAAAFASQILARIRTRALQAEESDASVVTSSIGITLFDGNGVQTAADLVVEADRAMYAAKAAGRDRWVVYDRRPRPAASSADAHAADSEAERVAGGRPRSESGGHRSVPVHPFGRR